MQCSEYHLPHINIFWVRIHFCLVYLYSSLHLHFTSQSYHLGGMGCSNGVVAINMIQDLLRVGSRESVIFMLHMPRFFSDRRNNVQLILQWHFPGDCCFQAHPNKNAVFVTTDVTTPAFYGGHDKHRMVRLFWVALLASWLAYQRMGVC